MSVWWNKAERTRWYYPTIREENLSRQSPGDGEEPVSAKNIQKSENVKVRQGRFGKEDFTEPMQFSSFIQQMLVEAFPCVENSGSREVSVDQSQAHS